MNFDLQHMKELAWSLFSLTDKLRFLGYSIIRDEDRDKGRYTIHELVSYGNYKALRTDTSEMDSIDIKNALSQINEVRQDCEKVLKNLVYLEEKLQESL